MRMVFKDCVQQHVGGDVFSNMWAGMCGCVPARPQGFAGYASGISAPTTLPHLVK